MSLVADAKALIAADGETAEQAIDTTKLDAAALKRWEAHPELIDLMDRWVLCPDAELLARGETLAAEIQAVQTFKLPVKLYRGFNPHLNAQNSMGLREKNFFFNRVRPYKSGETIEYTPEHPLSFSTELRIARAFGPTVVALLSRSIGTHYIPISNELAYLISQQRNHKKAMTQAEVIVLPSVGPIKVQVLLK